MRDFLALNIKREVKKLEEDIDKTLQQLLKLDEDDFSVKVGYEFSMSINGAYTDHYTIHIEFYKRWFDEQCEMFTSVCNKKFVFKTNSKDAAFLKELIHRIKVVILNPEKFEIGEISYIDEIENDAYVQPYLELVFKKVID